MFPWPNIKVLFMQRKLQNLTIPVKWNVPCSEDYRTTYKSFEEITPFFIFKYISAHMTGLVNSSMDCLLKQAGEKSITCLTWSRATQLSDSVPLSCWSGRCTELTCCIGSYWGLKFWGLDCTSCSPLHLTHGAGMEFWRMEFSAPRCGYVCPECGPDDKNQWRYSLFPGKGSKKTN